MQSLFLPGAIPCMISIVHNNEELQLNISKETLSTG
jgi:hypothetical protein